MSKDKGGHAFPCDDNDGMSLRDWFAGQALAGIMGGGFAYTVPHDDAGGGSDAAYYAYQYADAMIAEKAKT